MGQVIMMKKMMGAALALGLGSWATTATAVGIGGSSEVMDYVADIAIPPAETGGEQVSLCHLIKKYGIVGIPIFYDSIAYVLAPNRCDADNYYTMTPAEWADARASGLIAAEIPAVPAISVARRIPTIIFGVVFAFGAFAFFRQNRRKLALQAEISDLPPFPQRMLETLCHAAKSVGVADDRTVAAIATITAQLTGTHIDADKVRRTIALSEKTQQTGQFARFANDLTDDQKDTVMRGAVMMLAADGQVGAAEQTFLNGLAGGLSVTQSRADQILANPQQPVST
jgi:tellurite resistance protein